MSNIALYTAAPARMAIIAIFLSLPGITTAATLSDAQAEEILAKENGHMCWVAMLGSRKVGGGPVESPAYLSKADYAGIKALAQRDLVTFQEADIPPSQMFLTGATKQIDVRPTQKGLEAAKASNCGPQQPDVLAIEIWTFRIEKIVANEETKTSVDTYRVVKGLGTQIPTPASMNGPAPEKTKFMSLLKFDSFGGNWKQIAFDKQWASREFGTHNVENALATIKR